MNRCYARLLDSPQKVTLSLSKSAGLPEAQPTLGVRTRQRRGVPGVGAEDVTLSALAVPLHPRQSVNPTRILPVLGFGGSANLQSPLLPLRSRSGFLCVHAEEDVKRIDCSQHAGSLIGYVG